MRLLLLVLALAACVGCGGGPSRRSDYLNDAPRAGLSVSLSYTSTVRLGIGRVAGGVIGVRSYEERALDLDVICVALPERDGIILDEVAAVLHADAIHVEPQSSTEMLDVFFVGAVPSSPGPYDVACGVRPVGETGLFTFPGIANGALQSFAMRQPDLAVGVARSTLDVFDCETEGLPTRGRPICVRPVIVGSELRTEMLLPELDHHTVRCTLDGTSAMTADLTADTAALSSGSVLRFEDTSRLPDLLEVTCTIDPDHVLAEGDETNNTASLSTPLLADEAGLASTVRVVAAEVTAAFRRGSGETGSRPSVSFRVPFTLEGHPIREARITCTSSDGRVASGGFGTGGLPENITAAGEHSVMVVFERIPDPGEYVFDCVLSVTSPASIHIESSSAPVTVRVGP